MKPEQTHVLLYANDLRGKGAFHTALNSNRRQIHTLMEMREGIKIAEEVAKEFDLQKYLYTFDRSMNLTKYAKTMQDIVPILRRLGMLGFRRDGDPDRDGEQRTIRWILKGLGMRIDLIGNFQGEGDDQCKYTQVGTETKETPIYEFTCPDNTKPEDWAPPQE